MSSTSQSPDDKSEPTSEAEPEKKKPGSPGRYSMAEEEVPSRIDSTTRMPAVRPDGVSRASQANLQSPAVTPAAPTSSSPSSQSALPKLPPPVRDTKKKPPIGLPTQAKPGAPPHHATQRAMPAPLAKNAAPSVAMRAAAAEAAKIDPKIEDKDAKATAKDAPAAKTDAAKTDAEEKPVESSRYAEAKKALERRSVLEHDEIQDDPVAEKPTESGGGNKELERHDTIETPIAIPRRISSAEMVAAAALRPTPGSVPPPPPAVAAGEAVEINAPPPTATVKGLGGGPPSSRPPHVLTPPPARRISSLRPPPARIEVPAATDPSVSSEIEPLSAPLNLDNLDEGSIAFAFDALISEGPTGEPGKHEFDLTAVRELFSELAANHMRHVRDFMIDVKWGEVTRDWIHICLPPVRTLGRAAVRLELVELGEALDKLGSDLDAANETGGQMLDKDEKQKLLDSYNVLVTILPQAFALDRDKTQREAVIVQALLLQVPDVRKVTIDKLHAAGLTSLTVLFEANANDLAHVAGIPHPLAAKIVERVQAYRTELKSASPQDARAAEREKLAALNSTLKKVHDAYEEAQNGWGPEAKGRKRDHFRAREETWLEISVLLARFGEVDRLSGIEKVPFAQRITQLTDYLEEAREKYRAE